LVYIKLNLRDGEQNEYKKFFHFFLRWTSSLNVEGSMHCVKLSCHDHAETNHIWAGNILEHNETNLCLYPTDNNLLGLIDTCIWSLISSLVKSSWSAIESAASGSLVWCTMTSAVISETVHCVRDCILAWYDKCWAHSLPTSWVFRSVFVKTHGPTAMTSKFIKKKCKNFLYSFGYPSLKFHFMYTNLNMVFYKFIMAGRKSHPPKGRQEIPVGIASSPRPKLPSKSGWAIYCEPTGVRV